MALTYWQVSRCGYNSAYARGMPLALLRSDTESEVIHWPGSPLSIIIFHSTPSDPPCSSCLPRSSIPPIWLSTSPKNHPLESTLHTCHRHATHLFTWFPSKFRWFLTLATLYSTSIANMSPEKSKQNSCMSVLSKTLAVIKPRNQITSTLISVDIGNVLGDWRYEFNDLGVNVLLSLLLDTRCAHFFRQWRSYYIRVTLSITEYWTDLNTSD